MLVLEAPYGAIEAPLLSRDRLVLTRGAFVTPQLPVQSLMPACWAQFAFFSAVPEMRATRGALCAL